MKPRLLAHLLLLISGDANPVRSEKIARLLQEISTPATSKKITLHGVVFQWLHKENAWLCLREKSRIAPATLLKNTPQLWDARFLLPAGKQGFSVGALGTHARKFARELEKSGIPKPVWPTLPALFNLETAVGIPHIHKDANVRFIPAKLLAGERGWVMNKDSGIFVGEKARA